METRFSECIEDHHKRDKKSDLVKYTPQTEHKCVNLDDFWNFIKLLFFDRDFFYETWSYKKMKHKKIEHRGNLFRKILQLKRVC